MSKRVLAEDAEELAWKFQRGPNDKADSTIDAKPSPRNMWIARLVLSDRAALLAKYAERIEATILANGQFIDTDALRAIAREMRGEK
jgi:hypothetical protein